MLALSFLIESSSKLLVTRTGIKARTSSILGLWFPWPIYMFLEMRFDLGTLDSGERSLPFGLLVCFSMSFVSSANLPSYFRGNPGNRRDCPTSFGWKVFIRRILNKISNQDNILLCRASTCIWITVYILFLCQLYCSEVLEDCISPAGWSDSISHIMLHEPLLAFLKAILVGLATRKLVLAVLVTYVYSLSFHPITISGLLQRHWTCRKTINLLPN